MLNLPCLAGLLREERSGIRFRERLYKATGNLQASDLMDTSSLASIPIADYALCFVFCVLADRPFPGSGGSWLGRGDRGKRTVPMVVTLIGVSNLGVLVAMSGD